MSESIIYSPRGRIFVLECPDPMDLLQGRSEAQTLTTACKIIGYETASFTVRSKREFSETCEYVSTITQDHDHGDAHHIPLYVHVSCHGNDTGLAFGSDFLTWDEVVASIRPLCTMTEYSAGCVLCVSACGAGHQRISRVLSAAFKEDSSIKPPHYLFVTDSDNVSWDDATVAWLALYHRIGNLKLTQRMEIQRAINAIEEVTQLALKYFRWDAKRRQFMRFPTETN